MPYRRVFVFVTTVLLILSVALESKMVREKRQTTLAFTSPQYFFCISTLTPGYIVGTIGVNLPSTTWSITTPNSNVGVNPATGSLILINYLTAGTTQVVTVKAASGSQSITTNIVIRTAPCTNATSISSSATTGSNSLPVFTSSSYSFTLSSCTLSSPIGTARATRATTITYSMAGANSVYFAINPNTGQLYLNKAPTVNPVSFSVVAKNSAGSVTVPVTVSTTCTQTTTTTKASTTTITAAAAITYPRFSFSSYTFVPACATGSNVGQVNAYDNPTSGNTIVSYSITPTTPLSIDNFGDITVTKDLTASTTTTYTVVATDSTGATTSTRVIIQTDASCTAGVAAAGATAGTAISTAATTIAGAIIRRFGT